MTKELKKGLKVGDKLKRIAPAYEQVWPDDVVVITELFNFRGDNYPSEIKCDKGGNFKYDLDKFEVIKKKEAIIENYSIY